VSDLSSFSSYGANQEVNKTIEEGKMHLTYPTLCGFSFVAKKVSFDFELCFDCFLSFKNGWLVGRDFG